MDGGETWKEVMGRRDVEFQQFEFELEFKTYLYFKIK